MVDRPHQLFYEIELIVAGDYFVWIGIWLMNDVDLLMKHLGFDPDCSSSEFNEVQGEQNSVSSSSTSGSGREEEKNYQQIEPSFHSSMSDAYERIEHCRGR